MPVEDLLNELDYANSRNFFEGGRLGKTPGYSHIFRRAESTCYLRGVYSLAGEKSGLDSNCVPLVYVCAAKDAIEAPLIHRCVWNQNIVPFLLVYSPSEVRLYSGFQYDAPSATDGVRATGILQAITDFNQIASTLADFRSEAIDDGRLWRTWESKVDPQTRVDWRLLANLERLGRWLRDHGLAKPVVHSLIGKYVYLRYLYDRDILSERKFEEWKLDPDSVFGRGATLRGFQTVVDRLDEWLNGHVFPVELDKRGSPTEEHISMVAAVFKGDDPRTGQMHLDFQAYDFSHIPIETLSVIYEQFLHAEGRARNIGAYYTPVPLVEFVLQELEGQRPLKPGMRVLDASCGSGAFLVQCYRRLIEQQLQKEGRRLRPKELRELLQRHVFGMDHDEDACRVAEMSLVLTMLDYIEPPDLRQNPNFRIPDLHNANIFYSDFFTERSVFAEKHAETRFDWIVGNPPWKMLDPNAEGDIDRAALEWVYENRRERPIGRNQVAEAFAWKAADHLAADGLVGFLLPAMSLFKDDSAEFRRQFFRRLRVWGLVNFANLAEVLFAGRSRVPAAAFFYSHWSGKGPTSDADILYYAPLVANQEANRPADIGRRKETWNIVVNASEVRSIPLSEAISGEQIAWKLGMWGSPRDARLIAALKNDFDSLEDFAEARKLALNVGIQLREAGTPGTRFEEELVGRPLLRTRPLRNLGLILAFPDDALETVPRSMANIRSQGSGGLRICRPPHIVLDETRRFAVYSNSYLVIPNPVIGIGGRAGDENLLKALSLFLLSNYATYYQFFASPGWGVKREQATMRALQSMPVPFGNMDAADLKPWVELYEEAVESHLAGTLLDDTAKQRKPWKVLRRELNRLVTETFGLTEQDQYLIDDFVAVRLSLDEGKLSREAVGPPTENDLKSYGKVLKAELDDFVSEVDKPHHDVLVQHDSQSGMIKITLVEGKRQTTGVRVEKAGSAASKAFGDARRLLRARQSQWIYFDRNLLIFEGPDTYVFKPMQRLHWTRSQALLDADQLIAEAIATRES
jgi:hypothetical protein